MKKTTTTKTDKYIKQNKYMFKANTTTNKYNIVSVKK